MIKAAILTISDSCSQGRREDISGQTIKALLPTETFEVCDYRIVADEFDDISDELIDFADNSEAEIVFTTGGTGLGPRDATPEATTLVCDKLVPGLGDMIRSEGLKKTKNAVLSRAVAGIRSRTLIINLPGSPKAVRESLEVILDILQHAVDMLAGGGHEEKK